MQTVYNLFELDKWIFKRVVKLIQFKQNYYHRMFHIFMPYNIIIHFRLPYLYVFNSALFST